MPALRRPFLFALVLLAGFLLARAAAADGVRLVAADDRGITLRVDLPAWTLTPAPGGERSFLNAGSLPETDVPGRPCLPFATALIALPPGAEAQAMVTGGDPADVRENVRVAIGARPAFHPDGRAGLQPAREEVPAIADGPWPRAEVELGRPYTLRRQRVVGIRILPFRYDEATSRLWVRRSILVRVSWTAGAGAALAPALPANDRHWEPVLQAALINYDQGRRWRLPPARTLSRFRPQGLFERPAGAAVRGAAAFDESAPEVRVQVDTTAVYGLDYGQLAAKGYPAGVPIQEVSVHRHEFVEGQFTPYVTIELPIELDDRNGNGIFDGTDRIVVYAQSWVDRARPSIARQHWGPADCIYATQIPGGSGLRVATRSGWRNNGATPLASYPWTQRWERNFEYLTFPPDSNTDDFDWTGLMTYYDRPDSFFFDVNQLDAGHAVGFAIALEGRKYRSHWTWAEVRNGSGVATSIADSVAWYGEVPFTLAGTVPGTALTQGRNAIGLWGKSGSGPPDPVTNSIDNVGLNHFDVSYWRGFRSLRGYLACNSADAGGEIAIQAAGFSDTTGLRAWDVTDPLDPRRLTGVALQGAAPAFTLTLQDSVDPAARRSYVVFNTPKVPSRFSSVTRAGLENATAADIVYIVPEAMRGAITALAALRKQEGLDTLVAPLEAVNDEFNGGRKADWAIRRFLQYAYARPDWNTRFVLLVGDGSEDPLNYLGSSGADLVPIHKIPGPVSAGLPDASGLETVPSDMWYGWALDRVDLGSADPVPDLFVGRLPVKNVPQLEGLVSKLIRYEQVDTTQAYTSADTTQAWRRRMLLHSDDAFSQETGGGVTPGAVAPYCWKDYEVIFERVSEAVRSVILDRSGLALSEPEHFRESYLLRNEPYVISSGDTCRQDINATQSRARLLVTAPMMDRLNQGRLLWNYQGHANEWLLAHEYVYVDGPYGNDKAAFQNPTRPFLFAAFSCHPNAFARQNEDRFDHGPSIGEDMVNLPDASPFGGGAIASWASVGFELIPSSGAPNNHLNVWMAKSLFSDPPHDPVLGARGARVVLGEALALTEIRNYYGLPDSGISATHDGVGFTYTLLGDPATRITIGAPQIVVTANGVPVTDGQPVRLATGGDTLRLEADLVSNVRLDRIVLERTGIGGTSVVPDSEYTLTPAFPDTAGGGVYGGRRFHLVYRTRLSQSTLRFTLRLTDRYGVTSTFAVVFSFETVLLSDGVPLREDAPVTPDARLSLLVLSPGPVNPDSAYRLQVDGQPQTFTAAAARGDTTGRVWELSWTHAPYTVGRHTVELLLSGTLAATHHFTVESGMRLTHVLNFPDPFEETLGTRFLFTLLSDQPADVMIRVYTVSGRMIWERSERALAPGEHEWAWNGLDREGQAIANGVYLYRIVATNARGTARQDSRLVKLRRPRRSQDTATGNP